MRTQVAIVGAGPAGLTLSLLLQRAGIECVIVEHRSREHVERRARAGLLEQNTVELMRELGVADRLDREGLRHDGISLRCRGQTTYIAIKELAGRQVTVYGQHEVLKDLIASARERGIEIRFEVSGTAIHNVNSDSPSIRFEDREGTEPGCQRRPAVGGGTSSLVSAAPHAVA